MRDDYVTKLVEAAAGADLGIELSAEDVRGATARQELGISSLGVILVVATYLRTATGGGMTVRPEWVARLDDVEGILAVLEEIDHLAAARPSVT